MASQRSQEQRTTADRPRLLLIDNYDSFTFNLAQALSIVGADVEVIRNDALSVDDALQRPFVGLVISPGPGRPCDAGISPALLRALLTEKAAVPVLGVCLGHQLLAEVLGGRVERAARPVHGKIWQIQQTQPATDRRPGDQDRLWQGLPTTIEATRYHSLVVAPDSMPSCLRVSAWTAPTTGESDEDRVIMALHHRSRPLFGVQFHPESIGCPQGPRLLQNFVRICRNSLQGMDWMNGMDRMLATNADETR